MPKRAPIGDEVDPVRSRLAASVSVPVVAKPAPVETLVIDSEPESLSEPASVAEPHVSTRAVGGARRSQPESRLLMSPAPAPASRRAKPPRTSTGAFRVNKKFLVTDEESVRLEETLDSIGRAFGSRVSYAQASRALWAVLASAEDAMSANPRRGEPLRPPSKGDAIGMAEYEEAISEYLRMALRRP